MHSAHQPLCCTGWETSAGLTYACTCSLPALGFRAMGFFGDNSARRMTVVSIRTLSPLQCPPRVFSHGFLTFPSSFWRAPAHSQWMHACSEAALWTCTRELTSAVPLLTIQCRISSLRSCRLRLTSCSAFSPTGLRDKTQTHLPIRYPGNSVLPKDLFFLSSLHPAKLGLATSIPESIAQQQILCALLQRFVLITTACYRGGFLWGMYYLLTD